MGTFQIEGGIRLKGDVTPQGAKNEALQILCAVLLTPEKVTVNNIPDIIDVNKLISMFQWSTDNSVCKPTARPGRIMKCRPPQT